MSDKPYEAPICDPEVYRHGREVCMISGTTRAVEEWVKSIANAADARVDWSYWGGRAVVLHLGNSASLRRVRRAIAKHPWVDKRVRP